MKNKTLVNTLLLASICYVAPSLTQNAVVASVAHAQSVPSGQVAKKVKKVPAMRNRVYTQLARAQKLADEGDKIEGFNVLDEVQDRIDSLNSYERAMLWNFYGFMYYGNDDLTLAIDSFNKVIAQENIPESLYLSTVYSLAQLTMQQQDYGKTLNYLQQWQQANPKALNASQQLFFAQVYYQDKQYQQSLARINIAFTLVEEKRNSQGKAFIPKEQWLILQRANYFELKQPENVVQVIEQLVRFHSKPKYWLQLSAMYGEIGAEEKQLAVMEAAWQVGYINKANDVITLSQLYRYHNVPYKAAKLLEDAIAQGLITPQEKHLGMLAQAYIAAKDDEKAIPVLIKASIIADNGKFDGQLAQAYLNLDQWSLAIKSANQAIAQGFDENNSDQQSDKQSMEQGTMYLIKGIASFNLQKFDQALIALTQAQKFKKVQKTAQQWFSYVEKEQQQQSRLAMLN